MVYVDGERCQGCGVCADTCPTGAIRLADGVATIEQSLCNECQACVEACPLGAILAVSEPVPEGEQALVTQPAAPAGTTLPTTWQRPARTPWLETALAFVGTEVVPRVVASLLDMWDRRASRPSLSTQGNDGAIRSEGISDPTNASRGGGRHRQRRRGGR